MFEAMAKTIQNGSHGALATIVGVKGSAYRREGAKMFIDQSGHYVGLISGGCLEADVAEVAQEVIRSEKPLVKRYELGEDLVWGLGLGCPGTVDILIEPVGPDWKQQPACSEWLAHVQRGQPVAMCTVLEEKAGLARLVVTESGHVAGTLGDTALTQTLTQKVVAMLQEQSPRSLNQVFPLPDGTSRTVFVDVSVPRPTVLIFGAGHDAIPVARFSHSLGYHTIVVDARQTYNSEERFPSVTRLLIDPSQYGEMLDIGARTYVIIMNHQLERDREALTFALLSQAPFVGLLGPLSRRNRILEALQQEGCTFTEQQLARLRNPIGLDIGADTSEEIAVSILAEVIAQRTGHKGGSLCDKAHIHTGPALVT